MTSIHTSTTAAAALNTLRQIDANLAGEQRKVSSGLRVETASDDAAYWSISTTMRTDNRSIAAVSDALGIAAAVTDTAYMAMEAVSDVLVEIRSKLVASLEPGVDKAKIQTEIRQLAQSTKDISDSASFAGVNWLSTDIHDLYEAEPPLRSSYMLSSYTKTASGETRLGTMAIDHIKTSLFNEEERGGILDGDPRSPGRIGGIRYQSTDEHGILRWDPTNYRLGHLPPYRVSTFAGPISFTSPSDEISFDILIDKDNPGDGISPPFHPGITTHVTVDRSDVDAVYPGNNGVVSNFHQMIGVLNHALAGSGVSAGYDYEVKDGVKYIVPDKFRLNYSSNSTLDGSYMELSNLSSNVGLGGLLEFESQGLRQNSMTLTVKPFKVFKDVEISFNFDVNDEAPTSHRIDRATVNAVLGTTDGWINTPEDMEKLLKHLITRPNTIIEVTGSGVRIASDPAVDRLSGHRTDIGFTGITVNIEPLPESGILAIDVEANPNMARAYIEEVDTMLARVTDGASTLGALKSRIEMQMDFTQSIMDALEGGIGQLVDNDMEESSARIKALQTQQQLGIQALNLANSESENFLKLFQ